jgi:SAM-dependent methyltransferase
LSDVWDVRAQAYRESAAHREGEDLDLIVEWAGPGAGRAALDVGTGGGHVARRLVEAGFEVVSTDPAPGMQPDVICRAEDLPFADGSFHVVACRVAAHHFAQVEAAVREMARVSNDLVLIADNLYVNDAAEEADRLRDPSHVRNLSEAEWRGLLEGAGLRVETVRLARVDCEGDQAARVRELLASRIDGGWIRLPRIALKAVKG